MTDALYEAMAAIWNNAATNPSTTAADDFDALDAAANQAANRRDNTWLEGQAADRLHDKRMRRTA